MFIWFSQLKFSAIRPLRRPTPKPPYIIKSLAAQRGIGGLCGSCRRMLESACSSMDPIFAALRIICCLCLFFSAASSSVAIGCAATLGIAHYGFLGRQGIIIPSWCMGMLQKLAACKSLDFQNSSIPVAQCPHPWLHASWICLHMFAILWHSMMMIMTVHSSMLPVHHVGTWQNSNSSSAKATGTTAETIYSFTTTPATIHNRPPPQRMVHQKPS